MGKETLKWINMNIKFWHNASNFVRRVNRLVLPRCSTGKDFIATESIGKDCLDGIWTHKMKADEIPLNISVGVLLSLVARFY